MGDGEEEEGRLPRLHICLLLRALQMTVGTCEVTRARGKRLLCFFVCTVCFSSKLVVFWIFTKSKFQGLYGFFFFMCKGRMFVISENITGHCNYYCTRCLEKRHLTLQSKNVESADAADVIILFNITVDQEK